MAGGLKTYPATALACFMVQGLRGIPAGLQERRALQDASGLPEKGHQQLHLQLQLDIVRYQVSKMNGRPAYHEWVGVEFVVRIAALIPPVLKVESACKVWITRQLIYA